MALKNTLQGIIFLLAIALSGHGFAQQTQKDRIQYTIVKAKNPTPTQLARYAKYDKFMREIVLLYNEHAQHIEGVKIVVKDGGSKGRAYANSNTITVFGDSELWVYMHEVNHALGMGASWVYRAMTINRKLYGRTSTQFARELSGDPQKRLTSDHHAYWPYAVNRPNEASTLERRIIAVKMMDKVWFDIQNADMWTSRQIKTAHGRCLHVDAVSLNVVSGKCRNSAAHAWDISTVSGTSSSRIKDVLTQGCLVIKPNGGSSVLAVAACAVEESQDGMWEVDGRAEIRSVAQPNLCLITTAAKEMGLGHCLGPRTTEEHQFRNGAANKTHCMTADTTTPDDQTRFSVVKARPCINSVSRQGWRLDGNLIKFGKGDLCLQSADTFTAVGTGLHTWPCAQSQSLSGGRYFQNDRNQLEVVDAPGICVGLRGDQVGQGVDLELQRCNSNPTQTWFNHFELRSGVDNNYCMTAGIRDGMVTDQVVAVIFAQCGRFEDKQQWRLDSNVIRVGKAGTMCLQTSHHQTKTGTPLHTWPCHLSSASVGGRYFLNNRHQVELKDRPGLCVAWAENAKGDQLSIQTCKDVPRQKWLMKND